MELTKQEKQVWTGSHKGVSFEINNWKTPPNIFEPTEKDCWTYYLIIHIDRIPIENNPKSYWLKGEKMMSRISYSYYDHDVMCDFDWHGGITWYSKEHGFDNSNKVIKIGCDYSHLWDEGHFYEIEDVKSDVENTIERFLHHIPNYKHWCCGNGNLYNSKDGIIKNNQFYSKEYYGDKDWYKEYNKV